MMDSLLISRMKKDVSPSRIQNLSPEKYGKAAWADLTYTPSKLADNIIYREAATLKKNQEGTNKLREFEAMSGFMQERMSQLELERDGIEKSLNQQIGMYKNMLHDSQSKHENRLRDIQKRFRTEIAMLISQKEEEAKYSQAEKEIMEGKIEELERSLKESEEREAHLSQEYGGLDAHRQKLEIEVNHLKMNLCKEEKERAIEQGEWRRDKEINGKKTKEAERIFQERVQTLTTQKTIEKEMMERLMKTEHERLENIRMSENLRKSQEMRDIMVTFENETKRLKDVIAMKDRMLESLTYENVKNKEDLLEITTNYESQVNSLSYHRNELSQQIDNHLCKIADLQSIVEEEGSDRAQEREHYDRVILQLQDELQRSQGVFIRERDRFEYWGADIEKENIILKTENRRFSEILAENDKASEELRSLRDLLVESSYEIDRSKEELIRIAFERDSLKMKMESILAENEKMYVLKKQMEEESCQRGRSYYPQRSIFR